MIPIQQYNRFDDWRILTSILDNDSLCIIDLFTGSNIFETIKSNKNITYSRINLFNLELDNNHYDKIIITDYYKFNKIIKRDNLKINLESLFRLSEKIIIFQKNILFFYTYYFLKNNMSNQLKTFYSILPFFNSNPMFFLPIKKKLSIQSSLKIIIEISQTISPEAKSNLGLKYTLGMFLLKSINRLKLYWLMRYLTQGYLVELEKK